MWYRYKKNEHNSVLYTAKEYHFLKIYLPSIKIPQYLQKSKFFFYIKYCILKNWIFKCFTFRPPFFFLNKIKFFFLLCNSKLKNTQHCIFIFIRKYKQ